jgi:hypothetical protein
MGIDYDMMDLTLNSQPKFVHPWSAKLRLIGAVVGLGVME